MKTTLSLVLFISVCALRAEPKPEPPRIHLAADGEITVTCATPDVTIYYTRTGDTPEPTPWHPRDNPGSWTFQYKPGEYLQTKIPITFKAIAVDADGTASEVATLKPEAMIKTLHYADVAAAGYDPREINEPALDTEIAYLTAHGLFDKIAYFISKDFGHHIGTDQTDPDSRPCMIGLSFDDCTANAPYTMSLLKAHDRGEYRQRATFFTGIGALDTRGLAALADVKRWAQDGIEIGDHGYSLCRGYEGMVYNPVRNKDAWGHLTPQAQYNELYRQDQAHVAHGIPMSDWFAPHGAQDGKPGTDAMWQPYMYPIAQHRRYNRPTGAQPTGRALIGTHAMNLNNINCAALYSISTVKENRCVAFMYTHHKKPDPALAELLDYCATNTIPVRPYREVVAALNAYCTKYINLIKRNFQVIVWMDKYIPLTDRQKGLILFDCAYAELGADSALSPAQIVAHYQDQGYDVAFWTDESPEAVACLLPNAGGHPLMDRDPVALDPAQDWLVLSHPDSAWKAQRLVTYGAPALMAYRTPVVLSGTTPPSITGGEPLAFGKVYWAAHHSVTGDYNHIRIYPDKTNAAAPYINFSTAGEGLTLTTVNRILDQYAALDILSPQKMLRRGTDHNPASDSYLPLMVTGGGHFEDLAPGFLNNIVKLHGGSQIIGGQLGGTLDVRIQMLYACNEIVVSKGSLTRGLGALCGTPCPYALKTLDLSLNRLDEEIPATIGRFVQLVTLNLSGNRLHGAIPAEIGALTNLATLNLSGNALTAYRAGTIHGAQAALKTISLSHNAIPNDAGTPSIDRILADVLAMVRRTGVTGGTLAVNGPRMGTPTAAGLADIAALKAAPYAWTVSHNP